MLKILKKKKPIMQLDAVAGFGKLPLHPEFIKYRSTESSVRMLDQWYQTAYAYLNKQLGPQAKEHFSKMPAVYFFLSQRQQHQPLIGVSHASYDSSHRCYPFVTCRLLNHPVAREFEAATPLLYQAYFEAAGGFLLQEWQAMSVKDAEHAISCLAAKNHDLNKRSALEAVLANLKILTLNDFLHAFSEPFNKPDYLVSLVGKLRYLQQALPQRQARGIRFALPEKHTFVAVVFYLQLLDELFALKNFHWQAFWQASAVDHQANLLVYFDPLPSEYWQQFVVQSMLAVDVADGLGFQAVAQQLHFDLKLPLLDAVPFIVNQL